jgi:hypothetical protein
MELSLSIDALFRKYLDLEKLGFTTFEFKLANHAGTVRRLRNAALEDVINYNYFTHRGEWSMSNVFSARVALTQIDTIIKRITSAEDLHEINKGAVIAFPGYDKKLQNLDPIVKIQFGDASTFNENQLMEAARFMHEYIVQYALPFFEKFTSLQVVNDNIINGVPQDALSNYIPGAFMYAKKLVIMKLCDNPGYDEYVQWLLETFRKNAEKDSLKWDAKYELHKRLAEYMNSGKYRE